MENLAREVMEETGLTMSSQPVLLGIQDMMWPDRHEVVRDLIADMTARAARHDRRLRFGYRVHVVSTCGAHAQIPDPITSSGRCGS